MRAYRARQKKKSEKIATPVLLARGDMIHLLMIIMTALDYFRLKLKLSPGQVIILLYAYMMGREFTAYDCYKIYRSHPNTKLSDADPLMVLSSRGLVVKKSERQVVGKGHGGLAGEVGRLWEITPEGRKLMDAYCASILRLKSQVLVADLVKFFSSTQSIMSSLDF